MGDSNKSPDYAQGFKDCAAMMTILMEALIFYFDLMGDRESMASRLARTILNHLKQVQGMM